MKRISLIILPLTLLFATGCESFLSERPTRSTNDPIERIEQLDVLLNTTMLPNDIQSRFCTDDTEIPFDLFNARPTNFSVATMCYYTFDMKLIENLASDPYWQNMWAMVFRANTIISYVDNVIGDEAEKANLKAEAYFVRALHIWELVNVYCMPYAAENFETLGLPYRVGTGFEEDLTRLTLKETYDWIESDIQEALKVSGNHVQHKFRPTKASINAFLSRYYLFTGDYDKAVTAADYALSNMGDNVKLKNYNEIVAGTPTSYSNPAATIDYPEWNNFSTPQIYSWQEFFFLRLTYCGNQWFIPSQNLLDMFSETGKLDMRFKWFFLENGNRRFSIVDVHAYRFSHFSDGRYIMSGPTVQEVMLNKAEALVRKSSTDVSGAIQIINNLRANRIDPSYPNITVSASTKDAALKVVLDERRRELPFAYRWWDIRRFAYNETASDDVSITRNFYVIENGVWNTNKTETYTLPVKSKKYAIPLNGVEMDSAGGVLQQNEY